MVSEVQSWVELQSPALILHSSKLIPKCVCHVFGSYTFRKKLKFLNVFVSVFQEKNCLFRNITKNVVQNSFLANPNPSEFTVVTLGINLFC